MKSIPSGRKNSQRAGYTLVEMSVVIVIIGISAVAGLASIASYNTLQLGLEGSGDLREIYLAQKKMVVSKLVNPTSLSGYGDTLFSMDTLRREGFLPEGQLKLERQGVEIDASLLPPTCELDGPDSRFPNTAKDPNRAHSGDGLYDVGAEN